jgi:hypothetical protein
MEKEASRVGADATRKKDEPTDDLMQFQNAVGQRQPL